MSQSVQTVLSTTQSMPSVVQVIGDYSPSMRDHSQRYPDGKLPAQVVADCANDAIRKTGIMCMRGNAMRDYIHFGGIGYADSAQPMWTSAGLPDSLNPISKYATNIAGETNQPVVVAGEEVPGSSIKTPYWVEPRGIGGGTNAVAGLSAAADDLEALSTRFTLTTAVSIHITDGMFNQGGDPSAAMQRLRSVNTRNGDSVLFNLYLNPTNTDGPILWPATFAGENYETLLFQQASVLPAYMVSVLQDLGHVVEPGARAFVMNATGNDILAAITCGTPQALD